MKRASISGTLLVMLFALSLPDCMANNTKTHRVITGAPSAPHSGNVTVFMLGVPPPPYEEVAILQAVGSGYHADLEHVLYGLRVEAASLGCNAIVSVKVDQGSQSASGTAICARLRAAPRSPPAPAAPTVRPMAVAPAVVPSASNSEVPSTRESPPDGGIEAATPP